MYTHTVSSSRWQHKRSTAKLIARRGPWLSLAQAVALAQDERGDPLGELPAQGVRVVMVVDVLRRLAQSLAEGNPRLPPRLPRPRERELALKPSHGCFVQHEVLEVAGLDPYAKLTLKPR